MRDQFTEECGMSYRAIGLTYAGWSVRCMRMEQGKRIAPHIEKIGYAGDFILKVLKSRREMPDERLDEARREFKREFGELFGKVSDEALADIKGWGMTRQLAFETFIRLPETRDDRMKYFGQLLQSVRNEEFFAEQVKRL